MSVYIVTGKLGSGKTLVAVSRMQEALAAGRRVASNVELNLGKMGFKTSKLYRRLSDFPTADELKALGKGYEGKYDESKFGLLVLDEGARWLNSREWNSKGRRELIDWCVHARKQGWHVYLLCQDVEVLDNQVRAIIAEHVVLCRRLDKLKIPVLGIGLPLVHVGTVYYGDSPGGRQSFKVERWWYRGKALYEAYDTRQAFGPVTEGKDIAWSPTAADTTTWRQAAAWAVTTFYAKMFGVPCLVMADRLGLLRVRPRKRAQCFHAALTQKKTGAAYRPHRFVINLASR